LLAVPPHGAGVSAAAIRELGQQRKFTRTVLPRSTDIFSPKKTVLNGRNCQMCRKISSRNIGVDADGKLLDAWLG
jgi:hypothetical protein